ncbi:phosphoribosyltransferase family protein [Nisaea sp.]|uniref:orotate phosphoribosyltransferase n=1 Tax=Nisaea sp. TaxID=2024842 RepID=UPI0032669D03
MSISPEQTPACEAAKIILDGGAVHVRTGGEPYFFSSGWASPLFIDLKRLISVPKARGRLIDLMLGHIRSIYGDDGFDQIAGCELAGVPFATIAAHRLGLPLVIALKQARGFDRLSQCEGTFEPGTRTLLLDDLTTDGKTKANFKDALERAQADVVGIFVLFNYGIFPAVPEVGSLTCLTDLIAVAEAEGSLGEEALAQIKTFAEDAAHWSRFHGGIGRT